MKKTFSLLLLLLTVSLYSQVDIVQTKTNNDLKLAALPYYSFKRGIGITTPDSLFQLNIRFRMQNRATCGEMGTSHLFVCGCVLMGL